MTEDRTAPLCYAGSFIELHQYQAWIRSTTPLTFFRTSFTDAVATNCM